MNGLKRSVENRGTNGMLDLPIVPTQVTKTGNVGSLGAPMAAPSILNWPWVAGYCNERVVNGLKKISKKSATNNGR